MVHQSVHAIPLPSLKRAHVLYVVNDLSFFLSHRIELARAAQQAGFTVSVAAPESPRASELPADITFFPIPLHRYGMQPWRELRSVYALCALYRTVRPLLVHHLTIKPVIYGSLAARLMRVPVVINALPGLGHVFTAKGIVAALRRTVVSFFYRRAGHRAQFLVQHEGDAATLIRRRIAPIGSITVVRGSGVDPQRFTPTPYDTRKRQVVMAARLLRGKGVHTFVAAAQQLHKEGIDAEFILAGEAPDGHPDAISTSELETIRSSGAVTLPGQVSTMRELLSESAVVCLPTTYGEGVPRILLEAAACGVPIVATDTAGCREVVRHGDNGILVPPDDIAACAAAIRYLLNNPEVAATMGTRGRQRIISARLTVQDTITQTLELYNACLTTPQRVWYVTSILLNARGAQSKQVCAMLRALVEVRRGMVVAPACGIPPDIRGAVRVQCPRKPRWIRQLLVALRAIRAVPLHDAAYTREIPLAAILARCGQRVVLELHHPLPHTWQRMLVKSVLRRGAKIVAISHRLAELLSADLRLSKESIIVAHDGADVGPVYQKIQNPRPLVVYAGSLQPGRGVDLMVQAAERLPDIDFLIVGGSAEALAQCTSETLSSNVRHQPEVSPAEVPPVLASADALLMPYTSATPTVEYMSPLKMFEYMASGRPIVASRIGAVTEVLSDETAYFFDPTSIESCVNAISTALQTPQESIAKAARARSLVEAQYTWRGRVERILQLAWK